MNGGLSQQARVLRLVDDAYSEDLAMLNRAELDFFLKGDTSLDAVARPSPAPWLVASGWKDLLCLGQ